ncbi:MAG: hypothetical protein WBH04_04840 [Albidovulum sp.]
MKILTAIPLCLSLAVTPAIGQEADASPGAGMNLIEEGAKIILRSLLEDVEPAMKDFKDGMGEAMSEMGPALTEFFAKIDDLRNYHAPEILPNGDIIMRRKTPLEPGQPEPPVEIEI